MFYGLLVHGHNYIRTQWWRDLISCPFIWCTESDANVGLIVGVSAAGFTVFVVCPIIVCVIICCCIGGCCAAITGKKHATRSVITTTPAAPLSSVVTSGPANVPPSTAYPVQGQEPASVYTQEMAAYQPQQQAHYQPEQQAAYPPPPYPPQPYPPGQSYDPSAPTGYPY